jgi:hypothetical protein
MVSGDDLVPLQPLLDSSLAYQRFYVVWKVSPVRYRTDDTISIVSIDNILRLYVNFMMHVDCTLGLPEGTTRPCAVAG